VARRLYESWIVESTLSAIFEGEREESTLWLWIDSLEVGRFLCDFCIFSIVGKILIKFWGLDLIYSSSNSFIFCQKALPTTNVAQCCMYVAIVLFKKRFFWCDWFSDLWRFFFRFWESESTHESIRLFLRPAKELTTHNSQSSQINRPLIQTLFSGRLSFLSKKRGKKYA
jgi:hypothetical protein